MRAPKRHSGYDPKRPNGVLFCCNAQYCPRPTICYGIDFGLRTKSMKRREFITLIGGAAVSWPRGVRAQQSGKVRVIGVLGTNASVWKRWTDAFVDRLRELGWVEGRTVAIEYRWDEGRAERDPEIATELVRLNVDVILTNGSAVAVVKHATAVIPIVFAISNDPVGTGLVASLARPGGNITGLSTQATDVVSKRLHSQCR
jgi:putative tryptophan/tyrosine transport system substrate-binding protein